MSARFLQRRTRLTLAEMTPFSSSHVYRIQHNHVRASPTGEFTHGVIDDIVSAFNRAIKCDRRLYRRAIRSRESSFILRPWVQRDVHVVQDFFEHLRWGESGRFGLGQRLIRPEEVLFVGNL